MAKKKSVTPSPEPNARPTPETTPDDVETPPPVHSYYYDDATGYEIYDPTQEEDEEND